MRAARISQKSALQAVAPSFQTLENTNTKGIKRRTGQRSTAALIEPLRAEAYGKSRGASADTSSSR
ncbi:MAG: hypothetical protein ISN29_08775 [Gammaproteobacteria bacterium AqS3]|nr:hypothetical protein [Gammaproteobacteria bacterium AqS3]